jgi:hypothetical protein
MTPKEFIKHQNIFNCNDCKEIIQLQARHNITVRPLFWQGEGVENIPLVIMGGNPSVVGTPNEPRRDDGRDFDYYFDYYQNRTESERINKVKKKRINRRRDREDRIRIPLKHWTMCQNIAKKLIAYREVHRWKDYVLMEAIHCFYNKENDLTRIQSAEVSITCFNKHTRNMLLFLKPKMMVLLGNVPYELLNELGYLKDIAVCKFGRMAIEGEIDGKRIALQIPVLRHRAPNFRGRPYCDDSVYAAFREFAGFNGVQP